MVLTCVFTGKKKNKAVKKQILHSHCSWFHMLSQRTRQGRRIRCFSRRLIKPALHYPWFGVQGEAVSGKEAAAIILMDLSTGFAKYIHHTWPISLFPRWSLFLLLSHCRWGVHCAGGCGVITSVLQNQGWGSGRTWGRNCWP